MIPHPRAALARPPAAAGLPMTGERLSPAEDLFFELFLSMARALQRNAETDLVRRGNIMLSEYQALRQLAAEPGGRMRLQDLAAARVLSASAITRIIDRLEDRGLIRREQSDDDRRVWYAVVTRAGRDWLNQCELSYAASVRHALSMIDRRSIRTLADVAGRITP